MIVTLTGSNSFLLRRRLNEIVSEFVNKYGELGVERFDGDDADAGAIIEAISSLPFLASRKLVVLRDLSANKSAMEQIEQIISAASDSTDVIIHDPVIDKRTGYFKVLKSKTQFEEFEELERPGLVQWLLDEAKSQGGTLARSDANYLMERVGGNQEMLANELAKLVLYEPQISRESIELLTEPAPQGRIFDLLDASFGGQKKRALELYEEQRAQKVEPQAILAMIGWQLQLITLAKAGKGRPSSEISRDSGVSAYPLQKASALASKLSDEKVKDLVSKALEIDWQSKTKNLDLDEALKTYIVTI